MATGGFDPREERRMRRDIVREQEMRATMQMSLEDQGVMIDEDDINDIRVSKVERDEGQDYDIAFQRLPTDGINAETDNERNEDEDDLPHPSSEKKERTNRFQEETARYIEKEKEIQTRERLVMQQKTDLEERRASFERILKLNEERERSKMRKRMQEEMYGDSLRILKDLELDLQNKKKLSQQRERELEIRERYIILEEEK